jgi:hypothetical protein
MLAAPTLVAHSATSLDLIESELATLSAQLDAATHRQLVLIRQVDESGIDGSRRADLPRA